MKRKEILPKWIRFFAWIFLIFALVPLLFLVGLFVEGNYSLTVFGLNYEGTNTRHPAAFYIAGVLSMASAVSYGILWGKNWAITLGITYSYISLATIIYVVVASVSRGSIYIPLEPILMIPFLVILMKKKKEWGDFKHESPTEIDEIEPAAGGNG